MKNTINFLQIFLLICGVFGADADEVKTVMEGESVTLNTDLTETLGFNQILWRFGDKGPVIAQIVGIDISYPDLTEIFGGRLQLDPQTGSLIIKNMRTKHFGLYKLKISQNTGSSYMTFRVTVYESPAVIDAYKAEMKTVSGTEGNPVTLQTDVTEPHGDELIVWRFGDEGKLIAKHDIEAKSSPLYDTDERFKDRLKLDEKTGSLNITNTKNITDSGLYTVKISSSKQTLYKKFNVIISAPGLSPGAKAGIVIVVLLLVSAAAAAGVIYYRRKISELLGKILSVKGGDSVTLNTDVSELHGDVLIEWRFGERGPLIADIRGGIPEIYDTGLDERFLDRLKLDKKTGSLTIINTRNTDTGLYELKISQDRKIKYKKFSVSVCVTNEERIISVTERKNVILNPETEIQKDDLIQWMFGDQGILKTEIRGGTGETNYSADVRFRDRLKLDEKTGSLTITDMRSEHTGVYKLQINSSRGNTIKTFVVNVFVSLKSVKEGESLTLNPETEIQKEDQIQWMFGDQDILIAEIRGGTVKTHDDNVRFRGKLKLDENTGSLIITNMRLEHIGVYKLQINSSRGTINKRFKVIVVCNSYTPKTVLEGDDVTLSSDTSIVKDEKVNWFFNDEILAIGKSGDINNISYCDDEIFKGRLELDHVTGSLTIKNTRPSDTGDYHLKFPSLGIGRKFRVTVNEVVAPKGPEAEYENYAPIIRNQTDSSGNRVNESATVEMPLLNRGSGWRE